MCGRRATIRGNASRTTVPPTLSQPPGLNVVATESRRETTAILQKNRCFLQRIAFFQGFVCIFATDYKYQTTMIERTEYMSILKRWKDKRVIKVVTGIRRCGK